MDEKSVLYTSSHGTGVLFSAGAFVQWIYELIRPNAEGDHKVTAAAGAHTWWPQKSKLHRIVLVTRRSGYTFRQFRVVTAFQ